MRTYDTLTASDLRDVANRYFVDSQRVTVTLSNDASIAGIDGTASVDELVAAAGMAPASARLSRCKDSGETPGCQD